MYKKISKCRVCKSKNLENIIDLKKQYIQGSFIKKNFPRPYLKKIPLKLILCKNCSLVQLLHTTNKNILYKNYWYQSGINSTMKKHLKKLIMDISKYTRNLKSKVLDIGCNDGTLLNFYDKKFQKYGIDPSQIVNRINKRKIEVIKDFFPPRKKINKINNVKFQLITSIAMFYDLDDPNIFVKEIKKYLEKNGVWVLELSYLIDMLRLKSFDTICHEHLEYYSLTSLNYLMNNHDLKIFRVSRNKINGGSIRCYVTHKENTNFDSRQNKRYYEKLINKEKKLYIKNVNIYRKFSSDIEILKYKINHKIKSILKNKKNIFILGASTKGNTIIQFLGIDKKITPYAIERNNLKVGAWIIGTNIKIISEDEAKKYKIDNKLVLPWHFREEIIKRELNYIKSGGSLIFPLPNILIINKKNYSKYV
tara:strand:- start:1181 stop:2443 length:1263 start_codon:yes stop_codon:yes gene_type:complete